MAISLTTVYLKKELGADQYALLTDNNDDTVAEMKIEHSTLWATRRYTKAGLTIDLTEEFVKMSVIQYAIYLLFIRQGMKDDGEQYMKTANAYLQTSIGSATGVEDMGDFPGAVVQVGSNSVFEDSNGCFGYGADKFEY